MEFPFYWLDDAELCELMSFTHKSFFLLSFHAKSLLRYFTAIIQDSPSHGQDSKDGCYPKENLVKLNTFSFGLGLFLLSYLIQDCPLPLARSVKCLQEKDITGKKILQLAASQTCVFLFKYSGNLEVNTQYLVISSTTKIIFNQLMPYDAPQSSLNFLVCT